MKQELSTGDTFIYNNERAILAYKDDSIAIIKHGDSSQIIKRGSFNKEEGMIWGKSYPPRYMDIIELREKVTIKIIEQPDNEIVELAKKLFGIKIVADDETQDGYIIEGVIGKYTGDLGHIKLVNE